MSECLTLIQGFRMRVSRIDECGAPVGGACGMIVTDGFISVTMSDNVEDGDEFKQKLGSGDYDINQRSKPLLNWIEVKTALAGVSPELLSFLTGLPLIYDDAVVPNAVGFGTDESTYATASFAMEVWTRVGRKRGNPVCSASGVRYGYTLLPWLIEGKIEDVTFENGITNFTIDNITSTGTDWGIGPYDVILDAAGDPSPLLEAIPLDRHRLMQFTSLAPPASVCGCQELIIPS